MGTMRETSRSLQILFHKAHRGDEYFADRLDKNERELIEHSVVEMEHDTGLDRNAALADMRYTFIEKAVSSRWLSAVKAVNINEA